MLSAPTLHDPGPGPMPLAKRWSHAAGERQASKRLLLGGKARVTRASWSGQRQWSDPEIGPGVLKVVPCSAGRQLSRPARAATAPA